jgi:beta-glucosidase
MLRFPNGFLWGVATSAHQFEGLGSHNQWQEWEQLGHIRAGYRCNRACDWWSNATPDLDLCEGLGLNSIRVSVDWGRIQPNVGEWDHTAVSRYRSLLQSIRDRGMRPMVALHHFTHPAWFEQRGAFLSRESVDLFTYFAERVVRDLAGQCDQWLTFNEPNVLATFGYIFGEFPPGKRNQIGEFLRALGNMHRAHAQAFHAIHSIQSNAQVGLATNWVKFQPASETASDRMLASIYDGAFNSSSLQFLTSGTFQFPFNALAPEVPEAMNTVDFIGLNVYNRLHVRSPLSEQALKTGGLFVPETVPQGDRGAELPYGEAHPEAIIGAVAEYSKLGVPIYITENGVPDSSDRIRPWVLVQSLANVHQCIKDGFDIRGYFHWSLVDNFEWSEGWGLRFGLYDLDIRTGQRRPRPSASIYREIVHNNFLSDELLSRFSDPPVAGPQAIAGTSML